MAWSADCSVRARLRGLGTAPAELCGDRRVATASAPAVDVGSGAGLPGYRPCRARPDLRIDLVEPLARRVTFLEEAVAALALAPRVSVVRVAPKSAQSSVG